MKRIYWILIVLATLLLAILMTTASAAPNEFSEIGRNGKFHIINKTLDEDLYPGEKSILPASLQVIGEEAFEGTALTEVKIPDSVMLVGDKSFANNDFLAVVSLPDELSEMQGNPFDGSRYVVLSGSSKSQGQGWARIHGFRFVLEIRFSTMEEVSEVAFAYIQKPDADHIQQLDAEKAVQQRKQVNTGRAYGELKAAAHGTVADLYVQSRYFP